MTRERIQQKARTRADLLAAARDLAAAGREISIPAVAEAAGISKATAYRYFSDPGTLAVEASLDIKVASAEELLEGRTDVRSRVHAVTDYYRAFGRDNEPAFRKFLGKLMEEWAPDRKNPTRGARRIPVLEEALSPVRDRMDADDFDDLVLMLAACGTGFEQHVAMADVCGLPTEEADRLGRLVVDALLDRHLPG